MNKVEYYENLNNLLGSFRQLLMHDTLKPELVRPDSIYYRFIKFPFIIIRTNLQKRRRHKNDLGN